MAVCHKESLVLRVHSKAFTVPGTVHIFFGRLDLPLQLSLLILRNDLTFHQRLHFSDRPHRSRASSLGNVARAIQRSIEASD